MGLVPGVLAIGYMPVITDRNVAEFESSMRQSRPTFEVYEVDALARRVPAGPRRVHAPVQWYEPEVAFSDVEGFDSLSDPRRAAAMEIARLTRSLAISPYIRLIGHIDTDGVVMYWPVTDSESEALIGYAMAALDLGVMMDQALADAVAPALTWHLLDVTHITEGFDPDQPGAKMIEIGGRTWRLVVRPEPGSSLEPNPRTALLLLVSGLLATAFVAGALSNRRRNRKANREYEQLRELTIAKDQFLASVGHELRTPLTSVLGFAELLRTDSDGLTDEDRRAMISSVAAEATDLAAIVDDLLVAARSELDLLVVTSVPVSARAQVNQVLEAHRRYDTEMIDVVCEPDQAYRALGDPSRVRQILRNLITNACRYGGNRIEVRLTGDAEWVRIVVADDGGGVAESERESIFDPYYRAHSIESQPAALGIGLSVARQLARLMNGDLSYRRDRGWTVFELRLPASPDPSTPDREPQTTHNSGRLPTRVS
jgi:signal transduction histidine kinase